MPDPTLHCPACATELAPNLLTCPTCRQLRANLGEAAAFLKTDAANVAVPDAAKEWRILQTQLSGAAAKPARKRPLAPVIWFSLPLAAAAALAIAFLVGRPAAPQSAPAQVAARVDPAGTTPSTIAYVDIDSGWLGVWSTDNDTTRSG